MLLRVWNYIVYSSENAYNYSLTIKAFASFVPTLVIFLTLIHINVSQDSILAVVDALGAVITAIGAAVTAVVTLGAFVRKLIRSAQGTNAVTNTLNS